MTIEPCASVEQPGWLELRQALWPGSSVEDHLAEMASFLAAPDRFVQFVAYQRGAAVGFVEASLRTDYVNGTTTSPVAFLEGIYVEPAARRQGAATQLIGTVQAWAREQGCRELASDALLDNETSHALHRALGFAETERVVYFRKAIR